MPRVLFNQTDDLNAWLDRFGDHTKYTVFLTAVRELIFEPLRSTEPRRWAYIRCKDQGEVQQITNRLRGEKYLIISCSRYDWASDRAVEAHGPQDTEEG